MLIKFRYTHILWMLCEKISVRNLNKTQPAHADDKKHKETKWRENIDHKESERERKSRRYKTQIQNNNALSAYNVLKEHFYTSP